MLDFVNIRYQQYLDDYFNYLGKGNKKALFKIMADRVYDSSDVIQIFKYESVNPLANRNFLVIPSLFNSPEILFLGKEQSFVSKLLLYGNVYLVNWQESSKQRTISDYVLDLSNVINNMEPDLSEIELVGHCLGGNIAIGVGCMQRKKIKSLTLLTTPWDYSHFKNAVVLHKMFGLDLLIKNLDIIPKVYIQIMFFLLFSDQFNQKIVKYTDLKSSEYKETYLRVENWLQSGVDIPKSIYLQILNDLAKKNMFQTNEWYINKKIVNLNDITCPVCIISAREDRIAPLNSILPLHKILKNSTLIKVEGGHISYLLNPNQEFNINYGNWLSKFDIHN